MSLGKRRSNPHQQECDFDDTRRRPSNISHPLPELSNAIRAQPGMAQRPLNV